MCCARAGALLSYVACNYCSTARCLCISHLQDTEGIYVAMHVQDERAELELVIITIILLRAGPA